MNTSPGEQLPESLDLTDWTLVNQAGSERDTLAMVARDALYRRYSPAIYAWARARGYSVEDSQDLLQSLFEYFIRTGWFRKVNRTMGKFRHYLIASLKNHAATFERHRTAQKRGDGTPHLSIHEEGVLQRIDALNPSTLTPETAFHRGWACALIETTLRKLKESYESAGQEDIFRILSPWLTADPGERNGKYAEAAALLGIKEGTARVTVHRLREAYRSTLWQTAAEFLQTNDPEVIREELASLLTAC